jgi:hypothetical protein
MLSAANEVEAVTGLWRRQQRETLTPLKARQGLMFFLDCGRDPLPVSAASVLSWLTSPISRHPRLLPPVWPNISRDRRSLYTIVPLCPRHFYTNRSISSVVRRDVPEILGPMMSPPQPEMPEARADRFGLILSSLMAFVAALAFAAWIYSGLSFEKCSALASKPERYACYDKLRDQSRTPAKRRLRLSPR